MNRGSRRSGRYLSRLGGLMVTAGVLGLIATAVLGTAQVSALTLPTGTLYFTCFANQGGGGSNCTTNPGDVAANVQSATYTYTNGQLSIGNIHKVANLPGADGIQFLNGTNLVVGGQSDGYVTELVPNSSGSFTNATPINVSTGLGQVDHISVAPGGQYITAGGYGGGGLAIVTVKNGVIQTPASNCSLNPVGQTVAPAVMDTMVWTPSGAYYTASNPSGSATAGYGLFGQISIDAPTSPGGKCSATLTQLLPTPGSKGAGAGFEAAHGMAYDPFSKSIILFGSTMIAQLPLSGIEGASPVASEIVFGQRTGQCTITNCLREHGKQFGGQPFDQGSVDGAGHIFVSNNGGNLVAVDYAHVAYAAGSVPLISNAPMPYDQFLTNSLDDVAPITGPGGQLAVTTRAIPAPVSPSTISTITLGSYVGDTVNVSNFASLVSSDPGARGSVVFSLYSGTSCSGTPVYQSPTTTQIALDANGNASTGSTAFKPTSAGSYAWQAAVSITGGSLFQVPTLYSSCTSEPVMVLNPAGNLTATTTAIPTPASGGVTSTITIGRSVGDTVAVSGYAALAAEDSSASGSVVFSLYSGTSCSGTPVYHSSAKVPIALDSSGQASTGAAAYTPTAVGSYTWQAVVTVSGGAGYASIPTIDSVCGSEPMVVNAAPVQPPPPPTPNTPTITTVPSAGGPVGTHLSDTAQVTGIVSPAAFDNVSFALYSDPTCSALADTLGSAALTGPTTTNGAATWTATSPGSGYAPAVAGTYYWGVTFNSVNDSANLSSSLVCGEPVTITASGGALGAHTAPTPTPAPTPAGAVKAASTPTPNTGADLVLAGVLAVLAIILGALLLLTAARLRPHPRV
ncbi:MAG: hypothetical protein ACYCX9_05425 [Candidatus Dormibacteria bacterium]